MPAVGATPAQPAPQGQPFPQYGQPAQPVPQGQPFQQGQPVQPFPQGQSVPQGSFAPAAQPAPSARPVLQDGSVLPVSQNRPVGQPVPQYGQSAQSVPQGQPFQQGQPVQSFPQYGQSAQPVPQVQPVPQGHPMQPVPQNQPAQPLPQGAFIPGAQPFQPVAYQAYPVDPAAAWRRALRRTVGRPFGVVLIYQIIFTAVSYLIGMVIGLAIAAEQYRTARHGLLDTSELERMAMSSMLRWAGVMSLVAVAGGMLFMLLVRRRSIFTRTFWTGDEGRRTMRPAWLVVFIALLASAQSVNMLLSLVFSLMGITLQSPTSDAIEQTAVTVSMWLYIGLVGPVAEEIVFRGVLMKELKPLGRNFAIITSALAFALFHDDVMQGVFAFCVGLLLGFVAMEYSLVWAIVLHVVNNAILSGVFGELAGAFGPVGEGVYALILLVGGVAALIVVAVRYGSGLREYRRVNRSAPGTYTGWSSACFLIFCIGNGLIALSSFVIAMTL